MKNPRPIKAIAVVGSKNPRFDVLDIYKTTDQLAMEKEERRCQVEIRFIKYLK